MLKKTICLSIPCYNEEENIEKMAHEIDNIFKVILNKYNYSLEFIDNNSTDHTREKILQVCMDNPKHIKAIFNARNFGGVSSFYGLLQTDGDCSIVLPCDFQIPLEIIPKLVQAWENGSKIVCAVKTNTKTNKIMWLFRSFYYKLIKKFSEVDQIPHFTGSGLYDSSFVKVLRDLRDPLPSLRGMVAELGFQISTITYIEQRRESGKSKHNFNSLFNVAVKNMITYTKILPRLATYLGLITSMISLLIGFCYLILKFLYWNEISFGTAPLIFGVFFLGGIQLCFLGFIGEYLMAINSRLLNRPLVIEEKRINFENKEESDNI